MFCPVCRNEFRLGFTECNLSNPGFTLIKTGKAVLQRFRIRRDTAAGLVTKKLKLDN